MRSGMTDVCRQDTRPCKDTLSQTLNAILIQIKRKVTRVHLIFLPGEPRGISLPNSINVRNKLTSLLIQPIPGGLGELSTIRWT